jgi:AcrR family transcriptional regulator
VVTAKQSGGPKRGRGRPTTFDRSVALEQATKLFWERGYEGTSFDDLVAAMGISPSSFYNSFGSKERLYQEATEAYAVRARQCFGGELLAATDTRTAFCGLLTAAAREFTRDDRPSGCMIALAGTHVPPALSCVHEMMAGYRQAAQAAMAERIRKGIEAGDVPAGTDADAVSPSSASKARLIPPRPQPSQS